MVSTSDQKQARVERIGKVTVVRFLQPRILEDEVVESLAARLMQLVERPGHQFLLLDFGEVERLTTDFVSPLISLHQRAQGQGGRLALCRIHDDVYTIFETLGLPKLLHIYPGEKEALDSF